MRSEVLTAVLMKIPVTCDVRPCPYDVIHLKTRMYLRTTNCHISLVKNNYFITEKLVDNLKD
jgi:hypothetical protein